MIQGRDPEEPRSAGGGGDTDGGPPSEGPSADELECKICYCPYSLGGRRPKLLECRHRLCARCLAKILDLGEAPPGQMVCPFCRRVTGLQAGTLPDDRGLVAALALQSRNHRNLRYHHQRREGTASTTTELLLSPGNLGSLVGYATAAAGTGSPASASSTYSSIRGSPNFVVITIMEPPSGLGSTQDSAHQPHIPLGDSYPPGLGLASIRRSASSPSSLADSMTSVTQRWTVWNCAALLCQTSARALVWALGLLYFSSLPLGVYLLIMQRTTLGVLLVSLVPASLAMVMVYGFCQCVCREFWDCMPP